MCVLTGREIKRRRDQIFRHKSWGPESFQEASYDLRVDTEPYLIVDGKVYEDGKEYKGRYITIKPGDKAILPTIESFNMPGDLVGDIKIKFSHSRKGLSPLFGPKVDPYFGKGHSDERLYLAVSNLGNSPITLRRGERVFTVQFHKLFGDAPECKKKDAVGPKVAHEAHNDIGSAGSLGFVDRIEKNVKDKLGERLTQVQEGMGRVVLFGIILVASALLAGSVTTLFMLQANHGSSAVVVEALEGSLFMVALSWACIALAISIMLLSAAVVLQTLTPLAKQIWSAVKSFP